MTEYFVTGSSFITGMGYDPENSILLVEIKGLSYYYQGVGKARWEEFRTAESFGRYYSLYIKGNYERVEREEALACIADQCSSEQSLQTNGD